jgi:MFS family permease
MYLLSWALSDAQFTSWGWRIPFLFSVVLVAIGLWIRLQILETPMFAQRLRAGTIRRLPSIEVISQHWKPILLSALARLSEQAPFYVITSFALVYLTEEQGYSTTFALAAILLAAGVEAFAVPLSGHLSDTIGRKKVYMAGSALMGVYGFILFACLNSGIAVVAFLAMLFALIPHAMQYGPQASLIAESFPTDLRYAGAGMGYQLASVFAGGPAPLIAAAILQNTGSSTWISVYIIGCAVVSLVALAFIPNRQPS